MLNGLWNQLRGTVQIRVESRHPERVLNHWAEENLSFWDLRWESPDVFLCRISRRDWRYLHAASGENAGLHGKDSGLHNVSGENAGLHSISGKDISYTVETADRNGLPYWLAQFRHRQALAISLLICGTILFAGSFFIWEFDITGNETVPEERILRALERNGVRLGTFGLALDGEDLRNHILLEIPELQWFTVNVSGCRANVQVVERKEPPEIWDRQTPCNVIARRDGLILEVHALDGVAMVLPGMSVTAGEMLISGTEDLETTGAARIMSGYGSVQARTWHTLSTSVPLNAVKKRFTGEQESGWALVLGKRRIKIWGNSSIPGRECDKITSQVRWEPLGIPLPFALIREEYRFYETQAAVLTMEEAQRRGEIILREQLESEIKPYGEIRSALCSARRRGDTLEVTLSAECVEEIGVQVPIADLPQSVGGIS